MQIKIDSSSGSYFRVVERVAFVFSLIVAVMVIFELGFKHSAAFYRYTTYFYQLFFVSIFLSILSRYIFQPNTNKSNVLIFDLFVLLNLVVALFYQFDFFEYSLPFGYFFGHRSYLIFTVFLGIIREIADLKLNFKRQNLNPAQLFVFSFLVIILIGAFLLLLPRATYNGISFTDALFTSTSAVCVTGLAVVDTGTYFTRFGQSIILVLIQVGGLGIMTFASYFSYFFRGGATYESQLMLGDMMNSGKLGEVFSVLKKIILVTFIIEFIGVLLIWNALPNNLFPNFSEVFFFTLFHSISAFCNAGFSTLSNGLFDLNFKFNYNLQLVIASLVIIGGLGFPIMFNLLKYVKHLVVNRILPFSRKSKSIHLPWVISINTRIVLLTTVILVILGTGVILVLENRNTLNEHHGFGKLVAAFFSSVTTRTAGFNTVDFSVMHLSTLLFVLILMWIGASPASTGGGIKTSTAAIAVLNFVSLAKGKTRIEIFRREIADISVRRAFAIIALSLIVIGIAIFLIAIFDRDKSLHAIAFECFSAYSTVGLSLNLTPYLSDESKYVIIATMFIGRVSMLSLLIAFMRKTKFTSYRYPTEDILIN